jgi:endonuclease YncB( thermonuclease family)
MQAANDLDAFSARRPADCSPLSLDPYGRTVATWSVDGTDLGEWLVRWAWRWIGANTRTVDMMAPGTTPNVPAGKSGRAAMSSRGSIAPASARTESRPHFG